MIKDIQKKIISFFQLFSHPEIKRIKSEGLTYIETDGLIIIKKVIKEIETKKVPGHFIETGCALGGSAVLIGLAKNKERSFFVYDVFDMIPPPTEKDGEDVKDRYKVIKSGSSKGINNNKYYGYEKDIKSKVIDTLCSYGLDLNNNNIILVEGLYQNTLVINEPVAFAHIDCDWYESVMTCLMQITPNLSMQGVMIIDDYYCWSGCKTATDEYFADKRDDFLFRKIAGKLHISKTISH